MSDKIDRDIEFSSTIEPIREQVMNTFFRATILLITLILCSCSKDEIPAPTVSWDDNTDQYNYEQIYKATGCKVNDVGTISILNPLFTDSNGFRYLYGARRSGDNSVFWVSKYASNGNLIWETNKSPNSEKYTRALWPKELSNGDIVIACIVDKGGDIISSGSKGMFPTILSEDNGSASFIKVLDGYFYSYTNVYEKFFICGISDDEINKNANAIKWFSQISNEGDVLLSIPEMRKTNESTIFLSNDEFVNAEEQYIERAFLDGMKSPKWQKDISLPKHKSYKQKLSLTDGALSATYNLILLDDKEQEVSYVLNIETGKDYKNATGIELNKKELVLAVDKTYKLAATITPSDADNTIVSWKSSDEKIAIVNDGGLVTAISEGECEILANINGTNIVGKCKIKVSTIKVTGISLNESSIEIKTGSRFELTTIVYPEDAYADVVWSSSASTVAAVNNGIVDAIGEGNCVITATTTDGKFKASCLVTVNDPPITDMMKLYFSSSSVVSINGFITGTIYSAILNSSKKDITLTRFEIRDSYDGRIIQYTEDQSLLGVLTSGSEKNLGGLIKMAYNPKYTWFFTYEGKEFQVSHYYK